MVLRLLHRRGFFHLLTANFLTQFLGFGTMLLVAKFLAPSELGDIKILQSYGLLFAILAGFGLNTAVLKFCAESRTREDRQHILRQAILCSLGTTVGAVLLLIILARLGIIASSHHMLTWLTVYSAVIPFTVVSGILMVYLQALRQIREMARAQTVIKLQSFVLIVLCTWAWGFSGFVFSTIGAYAVGLVPLLRQAGTDFLHSSSGTLPTGFLHVAWFSMLANGVSTLGQNADIYMLDRFVADRARIGYYALATIFVLAANQVTATVQSIATPDFSERAHDESWIRRQMVRLQVRMSLLSVLVAAVIWLAASILIPALYGPAYHQTLVFLGVLLGKYILWSSYAVLGITLVGLGLMRFSLIVVAISTPLGLALTYFLLRRFGVMGAAWAQVATQAVNLFLVLCIVPIALRQLYRQQDDGRRADLPEQIPDLSSL
jgi:O-antigen/teichoic acid export membrane protein